MVCNREHRFEQVVYPYDAGRYHAMKSSCRSNRDRIITPITDNAAGVSVSSYITSPIIAHKTLITSVVTIGLELGPGYTNIVRVVEPRNNFRVWLDGIQGHDGW